MMPMTPYYRERFDFFYFSGEDKKELKNTNDSDPKFIDLKELPPLTLDGHMNKTIFDQHEL